MLYFKKIDEVIENEDEMLVIDSFGNVDFCNVINDFYLINLIVCVLILMVELLVNVKVCKDVLLVVE